MGYLIRNGIGYTGSGDILNQPVIYSDSERCIGVWRDGKPLYQKTYHLVKGTDYSSTTFYCNISDLNLETPVDCELIAHIGESWWIAPKEDATSNWRIDISNISSSSIQINTDSYAYNILSEVYITLKYTKTTDTAGTGPWAPTGATPIHYSLEEQVIGTWIDGKPLYQKSFTGTAPSSSGSFNVFDISSLNVDNAVSLYGSIRNPVNQTYSGQGFVLWIRYNQPTINENHIAISVTNYDYLSGNLYATIQYTKTTD